MARRAINAIARLATLEQYQRDRGSFDRPALKFHRITRYRGGPDLRRIRLLLRLIVHVVAAGQARQAQSQSCYSVASHAENSSTLIGCSVYIRARTCAARSGSLMRMATNQPSRDARLKLSHSSTGS